MQLPLNRLNILIMLGGIAMIALGYILMSTEKFIDAKEFSLSLYVSPPLIIIGHFVVAWGIIAGRKQSALQNSADFDKATQE
jgi:hypothetical protein